MNEVTVTTSWHTYPKLYALGHRILGNLFDSDVIVEEKIDGSQFSFGVFDGDLKVRSRSVTMNLHAPEKMFVKAIETVTRLHGEGLLRDGWTYRGEYLQRPKHNTLAYERAPAGYVIGFDINDGHESYLPYEAKKAEFDRLGLETVPILYEGKIDGYEMFRELLETVSCLGLQKIEGVVVKNYRLFGPDGKVLMGKFVSEEFKEVHNGDWKERHPGHKDVILKLTEEYTTAARWNKAIQRLRDAGELEGSPRDIGKLIKEVPNDVRAECEAEIKDKLFEWAWKDICRGITRGLPQFYKEQLLRSAFDEESPDTEAA